MLALQNMTMFPETVVPLCRTTRSVAAVEAALATPEKLLGCITVRPDRSDDTDAKSADLYDVGTLVMIKRMERLPEAMRILVQGNRAHSRRRVETGRSATARRRRSPSGAAHSRSGASRSSQAERAADDSGGWRFAKPG